MSVRQNNPGVPAMHSGMEGDGTIVEQIGEPLAEGNSYAVAGAENPLKRNVVVSIKASLNDLCLQKARGTWAPSQEALRSIFQQRKL